MSAIKPSFLVFSDDYGEHPSSCQHIMSRIAEDHEVVWVNTIGMRSPKMTLRDAGKIISKVRKMFSSLLVEKHRASNAQPVTICQPLMLPFNTFGVIRKLNRYSVIYFVKRKLASAGVSTPFIVVTAPNACDYLGVFGEKKVLYYCVDDYSEWPGLNASLVAGMEESLIRQADCFLAVSEKLCEHLRDYGKTVSLLTHGVDIEFFDGKDIEPHTLLSGIPVPRVGYFGLFDDRSNQELLLEVAIQMPSISFVITGNVECATEKLCSLPNVYFTGSVPFAEIPAIAKGFDICMLPYKLNKLTESIQPLKFKEYLATGKPVISTPIKEALNIASLLSIADTPAQWIIAIESALREAPSIEQSSREIFLRGESWAEKAASMLAAMRG